MDRTLERNADEARDTIDDLILTIKELEEDKIKLEYEIEKCNSKIDDLIEEIDELKNE